MPLVEQLLIAVVPALILTTGGAIYLNRRKSNRLYQRLFGMGDDAADDGYIPSMNKRVESIDKNVKDLNHRRIDDIEERLDSLGESIETIETRLTVEEEDD